MISWTSKGKKLEFEKSVNSLLSMRVDNHNMLVLSTTKSPRAILNSRRLARWAKGRKPEVTQSSGVLSHWITEYIHVFCRYCTHPWVPPYGPACSCSNSSLSNLSGRPLLFKSAPRRFSPAKNMPEWRFRKASVVFRKFILPRALRQWRVSGTATDWNDLIMSKHHDFL